MDLVLALEPDLADLVRETKFRVYNAEWLNAVEHGDDHGQVRSNHAVRGSWLNILQYGHEDDGESAYGSYGNTWAGQEGLWNHGLKFVGDDEED